MKLRYYQNEAVDAIFNYFYSGKSGNPVLALPTGTGKSLIIADFLKRCFELWPNQRFIMLTHVKELIAQNADKLLRIWPNAPLGIYSSGLNRKDTALPIIFGGVASVYSNPEAFGHRDIVLIDECHMISTSDKAMYQKVIAKLKEINPYLKVVGLSATPFRMGQGLITDGGLFTDIAYNATGLRAFNKLIEEGFICPLVPKKTETVLDTSNVSMSNGDFKNNELQAAVDIDSVTYSAIKEMIELAWNRQSWLVFASGIDHCEHINSAIQSFGIDSTCVHSKMPTNVRDERIAGFKSGLYRAIVSNGVLTTGFDHPPIDLIGMLRPTLSPGLWVQMLGRGTRPNEGKENCLVLDFAGNTRRLGPINDPVLPRKKGQKTGDAPIRICEKCGTYNHASVKVCSECGFVFPVRNKLFDEAGTEELIKSDLPVIETLDVSRVIYHKHTKIGSPPSIRVSYYCGLRKFEEYVCLEHQGFAGSKAKEWWKQRYSEKIPITVDEAMYYISKLRVPSRIRVHTNKKYPEILSHEY